MLARIADIHANPAQTLLLAINVQCNTVWRAMEHAFLLNVNRINSSIGPSTLAAIVVIHVNPATAPLLAINVKCLTLC